MDMYHFSDIASANEFWGLPAPEHPLLSVVSVEPTDHKVINNYKTPITISDYFYSISLKTIISGEILYGRTKYDFKKGTMLFKGPRQKLVFWNAVRRRKRFKKKSEGGHNLIVLTFAL